MLFATLTMMAMQATLQNGAPPQATPTPTARVGDRRGRRIGRPVSKSPPALGRTERSATPTDTGLPTQPFVDADRALPTPL